MLANSAQIFPPTIPLKIISAFFSFMLSEQRILKKKKHPSMQSNNSRKAFSFSPIQ